MYDRDYVKNLEREIELTGDNRFRGWQLGSEAGDASQSGREGKPQDFATTKASDKQD